MGGQSAQKGYLFQTLICLLNALAIDDWKFFTLEPDEGNSKIDIIWEGEKTTAIQIKQSINKFTYSEASNLAKEIIDTRTADSYELILLGAHADKLHSENSINGVKIHPARQVFIPDLIEQAAHRIDLYLENKGSPPIPARIRILLCSALITKLTETSISGERVSREQFDNALLEWIVSLYPNSITKASEMQCHVLANTIAVIFNQNRLELLMPVEFVNQNESPAIIESVAIVVKYPHGSGIFFSAWTCHNLIKIAETQQVFNEFLVLGKGNKACCIGCIPSQSKGDIDWTEIGRYCFAVYLKYRDRESGNWMKEKEIYLELAQENIEKIRKHESFTVSYLPDLPNLTDSLSMDTPNA